MRSNAFYDVATGYTSIDGKVLVPMAIAHDWRFRFEKKPNKLFKVDPLRIAELFPKRLLSAMVYAFSFEVLLHGYIVLHKYTQI